MVDAVYRIVEHDGGWAYKLGDVFSETFPNRRAAELAAKRVAEEQRSPGDDEAISWEDERGAWHDEFTRGVDRPNAYVADKQAARPSERPREAASHRRSSAADYAVSAYDKGDQYASSGLRAARGQIRTDPIAVMLLAIACGYLIGVLTGRKA